MSEYYHIVPWLNSEEWNKTYDDIYLPTSTVSNKIEALNRMFIWKARCPSLPAGIESTLTLLEVHLEDISNCNDLIKEQLLRLAYSSALMRFVNHMLDTETAKGTGLYQAAKKLDIPDWIIDLRHDTAHGNNLPSMELLREATIIGLDWLRQHYWEKYKLYIKDYISGQKETDSNDEHKITVLMRFCMSLSICAHSKCKIKNLFHIPDADMKESIVSDAQILFGDHIDFSNLKTVSVTSLINVMNVHTKNLLKMKNISVYVNKALLDEDSLFLSLELIEFFDSCDFITKKYLSKDYIQCFDILLSFLHTNNLLLDFILDVIKVTQNPENGVHRCHLAALWLSEIFTALKRINNFITRMNNWQDASPKKKKDLKLLFDHWFPNQKSKGLLLDLQTPVPKELTSITFIQPIISSYNPYLTYFIKELLNLVEPNLPKSTAENICHLAKLISAPEKLATPSFKIYTVADLKSSEIGVTSVEDEPDSDICEVSCEMEVSQTENIHVPINSIWRLASGNCDWTHCPIGLLPWHEITN